MASFQKNAGQISHTNMPEWYCDYCSKLNYPYLQNCRQCKKNKKVNVESTNNYTNFGSYSAQCNLEAWQHIIKKHNIDLETIIDVGCSYGSWNDRWKTMGFKNIKGIDANPELESYVSSLYDEFHVGSDADIVTNYGTENKTIAANSVVIHILEDNEIQNFFNNVHKALADDGYFIVSVVNLHYYSSGSYNRFKSGIVNMRLLEDYEKFIDDAGFKIVDIVGTFIDLSSMKKWLTPIIQLNKANEPFIDLARKYRENYSEILQFTHESQDFIIRDPGKKSQHWPFGEIFYVTRKK